MSFRGNGSFCLPIHWMPKLILHESSLKLYQKYMYWKEYCKCIVSDYNLINNYLYTFYSKEYFFFLNWNSFIKFTLFEKPDKVRIVQYINQFFISSFAARISSTKRSKKENSKMQNFSSIYLLFISFLFGLKSVTDRNCLYLLKIVKKVVKVPKKVVLFSWIH